MTDTAARILLSRPTEASLAAEIGAVFAGRPFRLLTIEALDGEPEADFEVALVSRDVTGLSTTLFTDGGGEGEAAGVSRGTLARLNEQPSSKPQLAQLQ